VQSIQAAAVAGGFYDGIDWLEDFPEANWDESVSEFVALSRAVQIETLAELDSILKEAKPLYPGFFTRLIKAASEDTASSGWGGSTPFFISLVVLLMRHKLVTAQWLIAFGWSDLIAKRVFQIIHKSHRKQRTKRRS
jgi:hypothetical protein